MIGTLFLFIFIYIVTLGDIFCSSKDSVKILEMDGFPSPNKFVNKHLRSSVPLKMKGAAEDSPAFILWEDNDYLIALKGPTTQSRTTNTEYFRTGGPLDYFITGLYLDDDVFEKFVKKYTKNKDLTLATTLPSHLRKDVLLPCPIQCSDIWNERLIDAFLWMSNEQLITKMHTDIGGNFICTYRGELTFTIIDDLAWRNLPSKISDNTIFEMFPRKQYLNTGSSYEVKLPKGDCLYIPANRAYHVESSTDMMAVSVIFDSSLPDSINPESCNKKCNTDLTMNSVQLRQYYIVEDEVKATKEYVMSLRNEGTESALHYLESRLQNLAKFDIYNSENGELLRSIAKMSFNLVDKNNDGEIDEAEYFGTTKFQWLEFGKKLSEVLSALEYYNSVEGTTRHSEL